MAGIHLSLLFGCLSHLHFVWQAPNVCQEITVSISVIGGWYYVLKTWLVT